MPREDPKPGSETLFVGQGTDIAFIDFSGLKSQAITVNANRTTVTVALPKAQLEPAVLNVSQSYVYAQQQGLFDRVGNFFSGNPNSQQQVYILAQQKIQAAAQQSPLLTEAQKNAEGMLDGMLTSLGFQHVTVTFGTARVPEAARREDQLLWQLPAPSRAANHRTVKVGVGFVPYSPLGWGFLTGTVDLNTLDAKDFRSRNPRFRGQAVAALDITLTPGELARLDPLAAQVTGARY